MNAAMKKAALKVSGVATLALVTTGHALAQEAATDLGVQAITDLSGTATSYIAAAFGVAVLVTGGFWGIRMMKKAFSKAG